MLVMSSFEEERVIIIGFVLSIDLPEQKSVFEWKNVCEKCNMLRGKSMGSYNNT